jgi:transcriptional regulator with XRE-family HTH domain
MSKNIFSKFASKELPEGPFEAGQSLGLTPDAVVRRYFKNRNAILSLLRIYSNYSISKVAQEIGIPEKQLEEIEKSDKTVPIRLVPKIAKVFEVDLKTLLVLLGCAKSETVNDRDQEERNALPLAAQYSGPDLTKQEKVDMEKFVRIILEAREKEIENET